MTGDESNGHDQPYATFIVPRQLVKHVKTALEKQNKSHPQHKIKAIFEDDVLTEYAGKFAISTTFPFGSDGLNGNSLSAQDFLREEGLEAQVAIVASLSDVVVEPTKISALEAAIAGWYSSLEGNKADVEVGDLLAESPRTYSHYGPLLLFSQHSFSSRSWQNLFESINSNQQNALWVSISRHMKVTHIATNAPIPLLNTAQSDTKVSSESFNIIRSPTNLTPFYGDLGPICNSPHPTTTDFSAAFWTHTKQNGITQVWAPRYTMFSRGNISEKARVLHMPSVQTAVNAEGGCTAVDLYAGIGYFAFSYVKAGVSKVLCWDINPWSIEGLRRGAVANKWEVEVFAGDALPADGEGVEVSEARLTAFVESNAKALARIEKMSKGMPPIRHVNCGLLPTSKDSYATAAAALDPLLGGWLHVHENFAVAEIECKAEEIRSRFQHLVVDLDIRCEEDGKEQGKRRDVLVEHVQRVKSYAPGVLHCVVDIHVPPRQDARVQG